MPKRLNTPPPQSRIANNKGLKPKPGDKRNFQSSSSTSSTDSRGANPVNSDEVYLRENIPNYDKLSLQGATFVVDGPGKRVPPDSPAIDPQEKIANPSLAGGTLKTAPFSQSLNPLSYYRESTYQIQLSMIREGDASDRNIYSKLLNRQVDEIILAQSGVTPYSITDFNFDQVISGENVMRNTVHTSMDMTIVEPMGVSFFDSVYRASIRLNIFDWLKCPYVIRLKFNGYDPNTGSYIDKIGPTMDSSFEWIWIVKITKVETDIDEGGVKYSLSMIYSNHFGYSNNLFKFNSAITIQTPENGQKLGNIIDDLTNKLNEMSAESYGKDPNDKSQHINTYEFNLGYTIPSLKGMKGIASDNFREWTINTNDFNNTQSETNTETGKERVVSIEDERSLATAIESLFLKTEEYRTILNRDLLYQDQDKDIKEVYEIKIIPEVLYDGSYDKERKIYRKKIIFHVYPFRNFTLMPKSRPSEGRTRNDEADIGFREMSRKRAEYLQSADLLVKTYDYWFTGKNTEIISFDFDLNTMWYASSPVFKGRYNYYAKHKPQIINEENIEEEKSARDIEVEREKRLNDDERSKNNKTTGEPLRAYVSDLALDEDDFRIFVISEDIADQSDTKYTNTGSYTSNGPEIENIATHILDQSYNVSLITISLNLKGDPYWLGIPSGFNMVDILNTELENQILPTTQGDIKLPKLLTSQNALLLNFKLPEGVGTHGQVNYSNSAIISGLYFVTTVKHSFSDGAFTSTLETIRDPASLPVKNEPGVE